MIVDVYIQGKKLYLGKTEPISVTSAVTNIQDITKNVTDYTKDFNVPASESNNKIFKHYYNFSINNGFDARTKVAAEIRINGITFKKGKARLNKVTIKNGQPSLYNLNFWGDLLSLPTKASDYTLQDLDLSAYDHDYTSANVTTGLNSYLFNGDIKYCLFPKKQYYYNSDVTNNVITDSLANIAYQGGAGSNGVNYNELRPSIKVIRIIEAIETFLGFTFSRDFFGRTEFTDLYLWLNDTDEQKAGGDTQIIDFDSGSGYMDLSTNIGYYTVSNTSASNDKIWFDMFITVTPSVGYEDVPYTINFYKNGGLEKETIVDGGEKEVKDVLSTGGTGQSEYTHEVYYEVSCEQEFKYTAELREFRKTTIPYTLDVNTYAYASENTVESVITISEEIPEIKIIDFLKGIFKLAKLVVVPTDEYQLYINNIGNYYNEGNIYDITKYVNNENYTVERGKMYNELSFAFEESQTVLGIQYEDNEGREYGTEEVSIYADDSEEELIDGDSFDIEVPFEQVIYERLIDLNDGEYTNIQYGAIVDDSISPTNIEPHLHYIHNTALGTKTIGLIDESDTKVEISGNINVPSHLQSMSVPSGYSTLFSQEYNEWNGNKITGTLYNNYYSDYIEQIFNSKKREFEYECFLPYNILINLKLNDVLKIDNIYFRIDTYKLNLITGKAKLNLINTFEKISSLPNYEPNIEVDASTQIISSYVGISSENVDISKTDTGYDTDWLTVTSSNKSVFFDFDENATTEARTMNVNLVNLDSAYTYRETDSETGEEIGEEITAYRESAEFYITQYDD